MSENLHSSHFPDCFYRVTVKGLCIRDGKILFTHDFTNPRRKAGGGELELPGGGLDFGENFQDALTREVKEETGLEVAWVDEKPMYVWTENHGPGRTMDWFYVLVIIFRFDVKDLSVFVPTEECREIIFLTKEEMEARSSELADQIRPLIKHYNPGDFEVAPN